MSNFTRCMLAILVAIAGFGNHQQAVAKDAADIIFVNANVAIKNHMEEENIPGTIKVFGCPAEEKMTGKNYMAQAGAFDGLDACLHNHPLPVNSVWNFHSTSMVDMVIEWQGKSAHAAATPDWAMTK